MEHDERADQLEREAEKMEEESKRVGGRIEETRSDWESKETDQTVPGAQAALPGEEEEEEEESDEDTGASEDEDKDDKDKEEESE